eukprot:9876097-Alexandrium_andersonii.AAC.1
MCSWPPGSAGAFARRGVGCPRRGHVAQEGLAARAGGGRACLHGRGLRVRRAPGGGLGCSGAVRSEMLQAPWPMGRVRQDERA